jgi:SH3-like domain-containing protein
MARPYRSLFRLPASLLAFVFAFALSWLALPSAAAAQQAAADGQRFGQDAEHAHRPRPRYETHWTVSKGYPFRVIGRKGDWLHVSDFEGDKAWVFRKMTSKTPHRVVKAPVANLRRAPGTRSPVVKKAGYGDVLRTLERRGDWLKVQHEGGTTGWVQARLTWGW